MSDKIELLPCPFCGEPGEARKERGWYACSNNNCPAWLIKSTIEDWNRRTALAQHPAPVNKSVIRDVFLRNGFTIKEGQTDLKPYVYAAAEELLSLDGKAVAAAPAAPVAQEPVAWISVADRLPSKDSEVIVSGWAFNDPAFGRFVTHAEPSDGVFKPVGAAALTDGLPLVISGAVYDFAGFLTTRPNVIEVGATANASPIADLLTEWAKLRGLSLADAAILSWQEHLIADPAPQAADQPAGTTSDKYRAELYDEVWEKARSMGYGNVTEALIALERMKAAEQPDTVAALRELLAELESKAKAVPEHHNWYDVDDMIDGVGKPEDAHYVAAANPATVLALIAHTRSLIDRADKYATIERVMQMLECDEREGGVWTACTLLLIGSAHKLKSTRSVVDQEGVTVDGESLGNWRVTVERIDAAIAQEADHE